MATPDKLVKGTVFNIQKYSVHDGPGIRTIVFTKGCTLRCQWCSNPESQVLAPEIAVNPGKCLTVDKCKRCLDVCEHNALGFNEDGIIVRDPDACRQCLTCADKCPTKALNVYGYEITVDDALKRVEEDEAFYARSGGGLTMSGGEPLMQADFAIALLREAKRRRIDTCIETCGNVPWATLEEAAKYLNNVFFDLKHMDTDKHADVTGGGNKQIIDNLRRLVETYPDLPVTVRTPVVPGVNDTEEEIAAIVEFVEALPGANVRYELLQYHRMGKPKYGYLGREYPLDGETNLSDETFRKLLAVTKDAEDAEPCECKES